MLSWWSMRISHKILFILLCHTNDNSIMHFDTLIWIIYTRWPRSIRKCRINLSNLSNEVFLEWQTNECSIIIIFICELFHNLALTSYFIVINNNINYLAVRDSIINSWLFTSRKTFYIYWSCSNTPLYR